MKRKLLSALLLTAVLLGGCHKVENGKESSSSPASRPPSSVEESSQPSSGLPSSAEASSGEDVSGETPSSEEETPANAVPVPIAVEGVELPDLSQYDTAQVTWGPGHEMDDQNRPTACVKLQEKYGDMGALFLMPPEEGEETGEKKLYLTFDEGYENGYTAKILDVLKEKQCPAVFFVTYDYVSKCPELVQRMVDEGHVVGNHSMNHPNMTTLDSETAVKEIAELHNYVAEHFNFQMTLFRPPEGAFSERSLVIARELGYRTTLWSYGYADWDPKNQMAPESAFPKVTGAAHDGAVYLLHAVSETNTKILGDVIDTLRSQGYSLERLQ